MEIEKKLSMSLEEIFSKRIICLIFYGSRAFNINIHQNSDYDFVLVLDKYNWKDIKVLNQILHSSTFKNYHIELNLLYYSDIKKRGVDNFQMRSSLKTYYKYLESMPTLLGNNIFKQNSIELSYEARKVCYYFKLQEYYGRIDKILLGEKINQRSLELAAKYTKDMIRQLVLSQGYLSETCYTDIIISDIYLFAVKKRLLPENIFSSVQKIAAGKYQYEDVELVRRSIYLNYLKLFNKYTNEKFFNSDPR